MMGMKFRRNAIVLYRNYSSKSSANVYKSKTSNKKGSPKSFDAKIKWTDEQKHVLAHISNGFSVFITGSAGTGKSVLLKHIIKRLKAVHGKASIFVTAPTGVAACALRGQTLHSFAGIGYGKCGRESLLDLVVADRRAYKRWNQAKALVIDEISMVGSDLFENLEHIARQVRQSDAVWGGIKLVVSGDFFQLPPVNPRNSTGKEFAFEADCWDSSFDVQVELTQVFRQSDPRLIKWLQGIRKGKTDPEDLKFLEKSCSATGPNASVVQLYPRIDDVNRVNEEKMKALSDRKVVYVAFDEGKEPWRRQLARGIAPDKLVLCIGARVMLIKNLNVLSGLVNGATGTVIRFTTEQNPNEILPVVKFDSGQEVLIGFETWEVREGGLKVASRVQLPLILAWALSIHKCQGMTLDSIQTNLSRAFGCGMVYVALSRVRSLEGLHLSGFHPSKIKAHPKVLQFYERFAQGQDKENSMTDDVTCNKKKDSTGESRHSFSLKGLPLPTYAV